MITLGLNDYESRDTSNLSEPKFWLKDALGVSPSASGIRVTADSALAYEPVYSCVRVLSEEVAGLPLKLYRSLDGGSRNEDKNHSLYSVLHDLANPEMTAFELRETMMGHLLLRGNAYAEIVRDQAGRVRQLWPLHPDKMTVQRDGYNPSSPLLYSYELPNGQRVKLEGSSNPNVAPTVLHLRGLTPDGLIGYSPMSVMKQCIGLGIAVEQYGARLFSNGARPGGLLKSDKTLSKQAQDRLKQSWESLHKGLEHAHRIAILEEGLTWQQVGINPEDAQFLESRKFNRTQIAAIFRVPPHMIADLDRATFSNIEHQSIDFVVHSIRPWLVRLEQAYKRDLLGRKDFEVYTIEHSVDGLLRGDTASRYEAYSKALNDGWMSVDEVRAKENLNPVPNGKGKGYREPLNMKPLGEPNPQPAQPADNNKPADNNNKPADNPAQKAN